MKRILYILASALALILFAGEANAQMVGGGAGISLGAFVRFAVEMEHDAVHMVAFL